MVGGIIKDPNMAVAEIRGEGVERSCGRDTGLRQEEGESKGLERLCACFRAMSQQSKQSTENKVQKKVWPVCLPAHLHFFWLFAFI